MDILTGGDQPSGSTSTSHLGTPNPYLNVAPRLNASPLSEASCNSTEARNTPTRRSCDGGGLFINTLHTEGQKSSGSLVLLKGALGLGTPRRLSGRLSVDADECGGAVSYNGDDTPSSARLSISSPLKGIHFSLGGPMQIPESDHQLFYNDVEATRASPTVGHERRELEHELDMQDFEDQPFTFEDRKADCKPPAPIHLKFVDVGYKVVLQQPKAKYSWKSALYSCKLEPAAAGSEKQILHGITGCVFPGEMLAMMGPSGSGKTTLLNVLGSRRASPQNVSGSVHYNDRPYNRKLKRRMGFVTQDDVLFPHLTVRETLTFSALLRLPRWLSREEKVRRVEEVMGQLGLQRCGGTVIGNQFLRGVSGGERKRVCIAQEILTDPSLLFLDEPTSGLDSTTALRLIQLLHAIAHRGRTVVTTIHQPSSRVFHMFEKLLLLSEGRALYFGPARGAMTYFDSIGFCPPLPMNPADFLLDLCSGINPNHAHAHLDPAPPSHQHAAPGAAAQQLINGRPHAADGSDPAPTSPRLTGAGHPDASMHCSASSTGVPSKLVQANDVKKYLLDCCENQISSKEKAKLLEVNDMVDEHARHAINGYNSINYSDSWGATWWEQFMVLMTRGMRERRHEYLSMLRVVQVVASALLAGCLWWQSKHNTLEDLQDQVGLIFFIAVFWGYLPLFTAIFTFPLERAVLSKERASNMYRLSAYFMARILGDVPLDLALPLVFMTILYFMVNLQQTPPAFFFSLLTVFLTVITSQGFGLLIGATLMDVQKATTFASIAVLGFMLAGGYFVEHIPPFISWIKYFSFQAHTFNILLEVQYGHERWYNCSNKEGCQSIEASPALRGTSLHGATESLFAMVAMVFGYRLLAYIALRRMRIAA